MRLTWFFHSMGGWIFKISSSRFCSLSRLYIISHAQSISSLTSHLSPLVPPHGPLKSPLAHRVTGHMPAVYASTHSPHARHLSSPANAVGSYERIAFPFARVAGEGKVTSGRVLRGPRRQLPGREYPAASFRRVPGTPCGDVRSGFYRQIHRK